MSDPIRDSLDEAIDRVATHLVSVADDPDAAQRMVSSLPARPGHGWWAMSSLPLQAAAAASLVLIVAYMRSASTDEALPLAHQPPLMTTARSTPAEPVPEVAAGVRAVDVEPTTVPARRVAVRLETEVEPSFGLAAIEIPKELTVGALTSTVPLDRLEPAALAPMLLNDLPLASDGQTLFSKE